MRRWLKWGAVVVGILILIGFVFFLHFIPPFTSTPPERLVEPERAAAPSLEGIQDERERLLAERGKYIVSTHACNACHTGGDFGPDYTKYLAGGTKHVIPGFGAAVARNLTPDVETGLGGYTDEEILSVLRSGRARDGRLIHNRMMPWATWSNWTEEDRRAVVVYLRHLRPVRNPVPAFVPDSSAADTTVRQLMYGGDYSQKE